MSKKAFQLKAKVITNKKVKENYFHCVLQAAAIAKQAGPGQFVNIQLSDDFQPFLRRPFSIHRVQGGRIEILYAVVGGGSKAFSRKKAGEYLDILGPLGNGFTYELPAASHELPILVAGGMGVAPLVFLAEKSAKLKPLVLIGAKTKAELLCEKDFQRSGCDVKIATDDGSRGFKGKVTDLLKKQLTAYSLKLTAIYACGPRPMLKEISRLSKTHRIPGQISLEEHMACGFGACLGCAVRTRTGFQRVCKEGPVFNAEEIIW